MVSIEEIVSLAKRRGFVYPGSEIYGGLANSWNYGPVGVELKNNIKNLWWKLFVHGRDDVVGIDAAIIMNAKVWEASGHVSSFADPLVECKSCHARFRVDHLLSDEEYTKVKDDTEAQSEQLKATIACPDCGKKTWDKPKKFNLLFPVRLGATEDSKNITYLRGETAQAMFVDFKIVQGVTSKTIPFGIAQIGKAFRNEITPGNFIFRTREFEQMEIEYFIPEPTQDEEWLSFFNTWKEQMTRWMDIVGIDRSRVHELDIPDGERAHYSKKTIDFEFDFPFGRKELYGLAYRTNYDLTKHEETSGKSMKYRDAITGNEYIPHVIEPTWGVDRTVLAVLCSAYTVAGEGDKKRIFLRLSPKIAPYSAAVFPLVRNKPEIVQKAQEVYLQLKADYSVAWDDRGNIGKRYLSQDEIGTPWCITIDYDTLTDNTVTVRNRDTTVQERVPISALFEYIRKSQNTFA